MQKVKIQCKIVIFLSGNSNVMKNQVVTEYAHSITWQFDGECVL